MAAKIAAAKTVPTKGSVTGFLDGVADPARRADCDTLVALMTEATGDAPRMWGASIVGFGEVYCPGSGRRVSHAPRLGFSPRKSAFSVYLIDGVQQHEADLSKLGPHDVGKGCLYLSTLADVNLKVLARILEASVKNSKRMFNSRRLHQPPAAAGGSMSRRS
jgi:hypothetical protein